MKTLNLRTLVLAGIVGALMIGGVVPSWGVYKGYRIVEAATNSGSQGGDSLADCTYLYTTNHYQPGGTFTHYNDNTWTATVCDYKDREGWDGYCRVYRLLSDRKTWQLARYKKLDTELNETDICGTITNSAAVLYLNCENSSNQTVRARFDLSPKANPVLLDVNVNTM